MSLFPPFSIVTHDDTLAANKNLENQLGDLKKKYFYMSVAVADMTDRSRGGTGGMSPFAGWNLHKTQFSASLLKIGAMFAAFQLRKNVNAAIVGWYAKDDSKLLDNLTIAWKPLVERAVLGPSNFPQLHTIFHPTGAGSSWTVEFTTGFRDDLELMASWSDDAASARVITALGHQYINGALAREDLYSAKGKTSKPAGGMWVGGNYVGIVQKEPTNATGAWLTGSPAAFMRFLDLLDAGRLVSDKDSEEMRTLMLHSWMEYRFLTGRHLAKGTFGKLGYDTVKAANNAVLYFDCGVFVRPRDIGSTIRYGLVMLGGSYLQLNEVGLAIDDIMTKDWRPAYLVQKAGLRF